MKLTTILLLITTLQLSAVSYSQEARVNIKLNNGSIVDVFNEIEKQTEFRIFYKVDLLDMNKKIDLVAQDVLVKDVLNDVLAKSGVTYDLVDRIIVITPEKLRQSQNIKGKVADSSTGEPLIGVNIVVEGTTIGTMTDINGSYSIDVPSQDAVLVFSFVGYLSQKVTVSGRSAIDISLTPDVKSLEEVVVVGYGTVKKRDLTGSVATIKSDDITKTASSNAIQSIQARMPGVDIQQKSGESGAGLNITLRGQRSITASNSPLILVDGVEYGSTIDLNPSDIESMDVLKDASSTAIYGTKGANGVIIITTKRGKAGKTSVNFNAFVSSNRPTNIPKVMYGTREVQRLIDKANYQADLATYNSTGTWGTSNLTPEDILTESLSDGTTELSIYQDGSYTDWADIILKNGLTHNYELSVSGGSEKTNYNLSLGTMDEQGLMRKDELKRYNGKINLDHKINNIFKVGSSILYTYKDHDSRNSSVFTQALKMTTITHPYLSDGTLNKTPNPRYAAHCNPLLDEIDGAYQNNILSSRIFGNTYLEITPLKYLNFKTMFALDRTNVRTGNYQDYQSVARYQSPATSFISNESELTTKYTWDNTLNYNTNFDGSKHDISVMVGQSMIQSIYEEAITSGAAGQEHYYKSAFYDLSKITSPKSTSSFIKSNMLSYFGRLNYKFNEKYLLTASLRADGSSTLAEGHKWGYFPSVALAWRVNEESFMSFAKTWLSNLKLRSSWGISGNAAVDPYSTLTSLSSTQVYYYLGGSSIAGNIPSKMGNQNLKWETTAAYNYGVDFGILNNRISGSIDYFISKTSDLLYYKSLPASSVYPSVIDNIGKTEAQGVEVALNTLALKTKDFSWDINWSYYHAKDKVTFLSEGLERNISGVNGYIVGQPVSIFYDYEANGCWNVGEYDAYKADWLARHPGQTLGYASAYGVPGTIKIVDRNDDGKIDDNDKRVYDRTPKHIIGMNNNITYKDFSLSVLVYARLGGYLSYGLNNQLNYESANWGDLDYWTPANYGAKFPSPGAASTTFASYGTALMYEKADYIKIKDITLSYNLPKTIIGRIGLGQVKVYGSLKNFFTKAKIDNYDPERGGSIAFPLAKQMVFGINVQF